MVTSTAPPSPSRPGSRADHAKLLTKAGTASGATSATRQKPRPGRLVRSTSQAAPSPSTVASEPVSTTSDTVLRISSATRGRHRRSATSAGPDSSALATTTAIGRRQTAATASAASRSDTGPSARRVRGTAPGTATPAGPAGGVRGVALVVVTELT